LVEQSRNVWANCPAATVLHPNYSLAGRRGVYIAAGAEKVAAMESNVMSFVSTIVYASCRCVVCMCRHHTSESECVVRR
jgi:hypothetical protein